MYTESKTDCLTSSSKSESPRAVRINNLDLLTYSLNKMIPLCFTTGHHNYARWLTMYVMKLLNIEDTHPGLKTPMQNESFSIR